MTIRCCGIALVAAMLFVVGCAVMAGADAPAPEYISGSLADRIVSVTQGWGQLGIDTCAYAQIETALKLRIKDKDYEHGLGSHANGELVIALDRQFTRFQSDVGVQWQGGGADGSVIFQVFIDDKKVFDSGVMRQSDAAQSVDVSVAGADELRLVVLDAGDGMTCDAADWAEARLTRDPNAKPTPPQSGMDMAPFGMVAAWDPTAMTGTQANRVQEFPAKDIAPYTELLPLADGSYQVSMTNGVGCIGMQWIESRQLRSVSLRFAPANSVPTAKSIELQYWTGESEWQGQWVRADVQPEANGDSLIWALSYKLLPRGTQKVRWIFTNSPQTIAVAGLSAYTRTKCNTVDVRIASTGSTKAAEIDVYNGILLETQGSPYHVTWDGSTPLTLKVRSTAASTYKADRTVLRFRMPGTSFGVAVEDLQANDCVYAPHAGLFVTRDPAPITLDEYLKKIAGQKTILEDVRARPDQDFAEAWKVVHNPAQNNGPVMLCLANDNRKFVVERDGLVAFCEYTTPDDAQWVTNYSYGPCFMRPIFGVGKQLTTTRRMYGGWLPMPVTTVVDEEITYEQMTFVAPASEPTKDAPAWLRDRAVCVADYTIENTGKRNGDTRLVFDLTSGNAAGVQVTEVKEGVLVTSGDRVLGLIDARKISPLKIDRTGTGAALNGTLRPGESVRCYVYLPEWKVDPEEYASLAKGDTWSKRTEAYWKDLIDPAMQIDLPDELLTNAIRASQVHCMLAGRNEDRGKVIAPWISAAIYGPLESEACSIMRGMNMNGQSEFARRSMDYFLKKCSPEGFITTGYTLVGTGECLWTLAENYLRTRDKEWMRANAPEIVRICDWVIRQREKTKLVDASGDRILGYGLMPPGVTADWNRFAYRLFNDAQYYYGLAEAAKALADIGDPAAARMATEAMKYRQDILRAYHIVQAQMPVVPLNDGTWAPADPSFLNCPGRVEDFLPGEDANRTWCYSIEAGAHHLVADGVIDPMSPDSEWLVNYLEDVQFFRSGWFDYPEETNRTDLFSFGGFSKLQPYYTRIAEVHGLRDDVKPFIRSYFNCIPAMLNGENLSFWEHFRAVGGWNKTHETGWFLCQTRQMFINERGEDLWLAPFVTTHWMKNGMEVKVRNAPTEFGRISYTIKSDVAKGRIEATIDVSPGSTARRIVIRLRHPEGKVMRSVTVNGESHADFDAAKETVTLDPTVGKIVVRAQY